jgi:hypothetical protein
VSGPAPKPAWQRRRRAAPAGGEWRSLPPLEKPVLPPLPKHWAGGTWCSRTRAVWKAWRDDWATGAYGPADVVMCIELAYLYDEAVRAGVPSHWAEVRHWCDGLGLTPKGKQNLRWRLDESGGDGGGELASAEALADYRARLDRIDKADSRFAGLVLIDDVVTEGNTQP